MFYFYIDRNANPVTGEKTIHKDYCSQLQKISNKAFIGRLKSYNDAKKKAEEHFGKVCGCLACCPEGHKK